MSAYICDPAHFAALAAFAVAGRNEHVIHQWQQGHPEDTCAYVARGLALQNIRSVAHRYPDDPDGQRPGPCMLDAEIVAEAERLARIYFMQFQTLRLKPVDILKMVEGYKYQSCESPDWEDTLAYRQASWLSSAAISMLPGYDDAPWEYMQHKCPIAA